MNLWKHSHRSDICTPRRSASEVTNLPTAWSLLSGLYMSIYIDLRISTYAYIYKCIHQIRSDQSLSRVWLFATPWIAARKASLSITNSWSLRKLMFIESVMPSNHLILCHTVLLLPSIFPSIRVFSNESDLRIRWPKCWSFSFNISPSNEYSGLIFFKRDWLDSLQLIETP